jgi:hypothetical protein
LSGDSLGGTVATTFAGVCEAILTDFSDLTTVIGYTLRSVLQSMLKASEDAYSH